MKVIMKVQLACPLGVFNPGDVYENNEAACMALIADGCAYDPKESGPETTEDVASREPGPELETAEAVPPKETAAKRTEKPKRGRPRRKKK